MRVSTDKADPGYVDVKVERYRVFYEGVPMRGVVTADEEQGFVEIQARDDEGQLIIDRVNRKVVTATLYGRVRIERAE